MNETLRDDTETTFSFVIETLREMTSDWDTDYDQEIGPKTRLIQDLGFESIDVVQLIVAFEEEFQSRELNFEQLLMRDGRYVDELVVEEVVDFLEANLNTV